MVFNKYGVQVEGEKLGLARVLREDFILKMDLTLNFERQAAFG